MALSLSKFSGLALAFPGLGKTTYCSSHPDCADADAGHFRWMIGSANAQEAYLRELVGFLRRIAHMNRIVFTNDPMVLDRASDYAVLRGAYSRIIMFLPSFNADVWRERMLTRGDDEEWVQNIFANYDNDLRTWAEVASGSAVPIFRVNFLSDVEV